MSAIDYPRLHAELTRDEGCVLHPYRDTKGKLTIGVGRNLDDCGLTSAEAIAIGAARTVATQRAGRLHYSIRTDAVITMAEAQRLLDADIASHEQLLDAHLPWWRTLDGVRQRVLLNMVFNMGWGDGRHGLSTFRNTLGLIQAGRYAQAAANLGGSQWRRDVHARADRLIHAIETGVMPS